MTLNIYILTYNRAKYLKKTIKSILEQTYKDFSLFILDNASTDNTECVVNFFNDKRITYIKHNKNLGSCGNIIYAIKHCTADCFIIFHDDDIMCPDLVYKEMLVLEKGNAVAVSGKALLINENDTEMLLNAKIKKENGKSYKENQLFKEYLETGKTLVFPAILYRTDFIKKNNILPRENVGPCCDIIFYFDIARKGGLLFEIPDIVMKYRIHSGQDSWINKYSMFEQLCSFLIHDEDYKELFMKKRKEYYVVRMKGVLSDFWNKRINKSQLLETRNMFRNCMKINYVFKIDILVEITCIMPKIIKYLYEKYKIVKMNGYKI